MCTGDSMTQLHEYVVVVPDPCGDGLGNVSILDQEGDQGLIRFVETEIYFRFSN